MSAYEEMLNEQHGGYVVKEGEDALKNVMFREYILKYNERGAFDLYIPCKMSATILRCQLIKENVKHIAWYKLDELVQKAPFRLTTDLDIDMQAESKPDTKYIRICHIENYKEFKDRCWSSTINIGEQIYLPMNPDDGGGWSPTVFYIKEVHNNYVVSSMDAYNNVSYNLRRDEYNHSWFTSYDDCVKACEAGGRL